MLQNKRLFPIEEARFTREIEPIIHQSYIWKGRPPKISHYNVFCAVLYILRTGMAWRDLPKEFGNWHTIYTRFSRWSEKGLWWKILYTLQSQRKITLDLVMLDSTTFKVHRHGGGLKGGFKLRAKASQA
jgi:transposase